MPTVSVIIPFHNRVKWVAEAVQSVLDQTYSNFEVILVDDGSTEDITQCNFINDNRIRYIRQDNRGPAVARNRGIDVALGRYVAFLDSDDLFLPTKLEIQIAHMEDHPNVPFSHTSYQRISKAGEPLEIINSGRFTGKVYPEILLNCPIGTSTVMIHRDILGDMRFETSIRSGEDVILWIRIAKEYKIMGIDNPLTKIRIHGYYTFYDPQKRLTGLINIMNYAMKYDNKLNFSFRQKFFSTICTRVGMLHLQRGEKKEGYRYFIRAILAWPLNYRPYIALAASEIPDRYQPLCRQIWSRIKNQSTRFSRFR